MHQPSSRCKRVRAVCWWVLCQAQQGWIQSAFGSKSFAKQLCRARPLCVMQTKEEVYPLTYPQFINPLDFNSGVVENGVTWRHENRDDSNRCQWNVNGMSMDISGYQTCRWDIWSLHGNRSFHLWRLRHRSCVFNKVLKEELLWIHFARDDFAHMIYAFGTNSILNMTVQQ